jgi:hypothetical protein
MTAQDVQTYYQRGWDRQPIGDLPTDPGLAAVAQASYAEGAWDKDEQEALEYLQSKRR